MSPVFSDNVICCFCHLFCHIPFATRQDCEKDAETCSTVVSTRYGPFNAANRNRTRRASPTAAETTHPRHPDDAEGEAPTNVPEQPRYSEQEAEYAAYLSRHTMYPGFTAAPKFTIPDYTAAAETSSDVQSTGSDKGKAPADSTTESRQGKISDEHAISVSSQSSNSESDENENENEEDSQEEWSFQQTEKRTASGASRYLQRDEYPSEEEDNEDSLLLPGRQRVSASRVVHIPDSKLNRSIRIVFYKLGFFCAIHPWQIILAASTILAFLCTGWAYFSIETDPVKLWTAPSSLTAREKVFFDENFGPFYRIEQVIIVNNESRNKDELESKKLYSESDGRPESNGHSILSPAFIGHLFQIETDVAALLAPDTNTTLNDICYRPRPDGPCAVQSLTGYWGNDVKNFDPKDWRDRLEDCIKTPSSCPSAAGQPISPDLVLNNRDDYLASTSVTMTWLVSNSVDQDVRRIAASWETTLIDYFKSLADSTFSADYKVAFSTEVSV